jgi:NADH-quinone oxidoreductase subunit J
MTALQLIFLATAAMTLISAILVVTRRNMVHAALFLVVSLFGVAVFFVLLNASYLAVAQVVIYIGAIAILMIFAVMFTRRIASDDVVASNRNAGWAGLLSALVFFSLVIMLGGWSQFNLLAPQLTRAGVAPADLGQSLAVELGASLVSPSQYVIPFEVASILLLAALIGSIVIAWPRKIEGDD